MNTTLRWTLAACLGACALHAHAAAGDISYDTPAAKADEDRSAQFDMFSILTHVITSAPVGGTAARQNFESGFSDGQVLDSWVKLADTKVKFGFGDSLAALQWQGVVGKVDADSATAGLDHPQGTYGNVAGVTDDKRNYIADHYFLSSGQASSSSFFVMQFAQPVNFVAFTMIDYAAGTGGTTNFTLWNGETLTNATKITNANNENRSYDADQTPGSLNYIIGNGPNLSPFQNVRPTFNFVVLQMDAADATVGFDNLVVALTPVPEPGTPAMLLAGLGLLGLVARRRKTTR